MDLSALVGGLVRHGLTTFGGGLMMTGDEVNIAAGAVSALFGVFWSVWNKRSA